MERPNLAPCPFCGGPKVACRRLMDDAGEHTGWRALCVPCHVRLVRLAGECRSLDAAREAVVAAWNRRASPPARPPLPPDQPAPCPLCDCADIAVTQRDEECHWTLPDGGSRGRVQVVVCRVCGLTMAGWRPVYGERFSIQRTDTVAAWNRRVAPADWVDPRTCLYVNAMRKS